MKYWLIPLDFYFTVNILRLQRRIIFFDEQLSFTFVEADICATIFISLLNKVSFIDRNFYFQRMHYFKVAISSNMLLVCKIRDDWKTFFNFDKFNYSTSLEIHFFSFITLRPLKWNYFCSFVPSEKLEPNNGTERDVHFLKTKDDLEEPSMDGKLIQDLFFTRPTVAENESLELSLPSLFWSKKKGRTKVNRHTFSTAIAPDEQNYTK